MLVLVKKKNDKHPKFKVSDHVRIPKQRNIFAKAYVPSKSEEVFVIKKLKILFCGWKLMILMVENSWKQIR